RRNQLDDAEGVDRALEEEVKRARYLGRRQALRSQRIADALEDELADLGRRGFHFRTPRGCGSGHRGRTYRSRSEAVPEGREAHGAPCSPAAASRADPSVWPDRPPCLRRMPRFQPL